MPFLTRPLIMALALPAAFCSPCTVFAQDITPPKPAALQELVECRTITDNAQRLACFDEKVSNLAEAEDKGDILIADKNVVDKAREDIFGLSVSDNPLFVGKEGQRLDQIESTITSATMTASRKWVFKLENGSTWQQTEINSLRRSPKPGYKVVISRGLFGSFKAEIEGQTFTKVMRIN